MRATYSRIIGSGYDEGRGRLRGTPDGLPGES